MPPPKHKRSTDEIFSEPQRLHKVLASCGFGSRRAMEEMILAGRITVNRMPADVGQKVSPGDEVRINGELVKVRFAEPRARVLMYHKPAGELVTRDDPEGRPTVFEKLPSIGAGKWINVGRLDYNTEGLLLFTNSGELANRLMHPRYEVEREYAVRIMGRLTEEQMQALLGGVRLDDGPARCEKVADGGGDEDGANHWYHVVLKEGRNREVRRLFEALGVMVSRLIRTRYGTIAMPTLLKRGQIAELDAADVGAIVAAAGLRPQAGGAAREPTEAHAARKKAHAPGPRPGRRTGQRRPQGQGNAHADRDPRIAQHSEGGNRVKAHHESRVHAKPGGGQRSGPPPGAGQRPPKRGTGPKGPQPAGERGPYANPRHATGSPAHRPQRPPRVQHDFDQVQPQSNANAAPFGRTTLTVPGGAPREYGNGTGPRQRSGPRAHPTKYGKQGGHAQGSAHAGHQDHRRDKFGANGPGRGQRPPMRPRDDVNGNVAPRREAEANAAPASEANGNFAPRREANGNVVPKSEANGNVAPRGEKPASNDGDA